MSCCSAINCSNRACKAEINHAKGLTFHRFPFSRPELLEQWLVNMRRVDLSGIPWRPSKYQRICSAHFAPECFDRTGQTVRLKDNAVPTIFNVPQHLQQKICPVNQLRNIALDENGTFMTDFDPERSQREMRKLNRKIHKENKKQNQMYDESGRLLENSLDVCDCLENDCMGCHFPCPKCGSEKCGTECRCERRWTYEQIEVEGTTLRFTWSATKLS